MSEETKELQALQKATEEKNLERFQEISKSLHYVDLAEIYEDLSETHRDFFTEALGAERFAEVIAEIPDTLVESSLERFDTEDQREILDQVSDDDRVDLLQDVSDEAREHLLTLVEPDDIDVTRSLLRYGEDTAGGRMTMSFGKVSLEMTIKQALDSLQKEQGETETLARIYVTDEKDRLIGRLRFRDLAFNKWDTAVKDLIRPCEHTILASADQEDAAQIFSKYDLIALPGIDEQDRLLGIITHDDAIA